jgi:hypothetical protein
MGLRIHERTVWDRHRCQRCGPAFRLVAGYVNDDDGAYALYWAACHMHPEHRVFFDVLIGTWWNDGADDRVTFSCEIHQDSSMVQDAPLATPGDDAMFGRKLTRHQALAHPWIPIFWSVVDLAQLEDEAVREAISAPSGDT